MKLSWTFPPLWEYLSGYVSRRAAVFHFVESSGQILSDRLSSAGTSRSLSLRWQAADLGLSRTVCTVVTSGYKMPTPWKGNKNRGIWDIFLFLLVIHALRQVFQIIYTGKEGKDDR